MAESNRKWSPTLIDDIVEKIGHNSIVPVIGPGVFYVEEKGRRCNIQEFIVGELLRRYLPDVTDASTEYYVQGGFRGMTRLGRLFQTHNLNMCSSLRQLFNDETVKRRIKLDPYVLEFLQRGRFRLVLTTCYFQTLNQLVSYENHPYTEVAYCKEQKTLQDISLSDVDQQLTAPTLFYLFGKIGPVSKSYVVTENDFLSFLHCIQDTNHYPRRLKDYLQDRYILTLGCEIPDWTFRFLLYSLKGKDGELNSADGAINSFAGGAVTQGLDEGLSEFLADIKYFTNDRIDDFLADVNAGLPQVDRPSIFLSMVHEDYQTLGTEISNVLGRYFNVWFFEQQDDTTQYWKSIQHGLEHCQYFMPVVTSNTILKLVMGDITDEERRDDEPGIVTEWRMALAHRRKHMGDSLYCLPYLTTGDIGMFRTALSKAHLDDLKDLFFPAEGVQQILSPVGRLLDDDVIKSLISKTVKA